MATKAKKTTRKTTTSKSTTRKTTTPKATTTATAEEPSIGSKSCAYPSCSARAAQEFGDNKVPSCDIHATIFETQAEDGAGIQHLMATYKG